MQDLRLIFVNGHAGFQETAVKTLTGQAREGDIGFAGENHLHRSSEMNDASQRAAQAPGGQKIGDDDLNDSSAIEIAPKSLFDRAGAAPRTAQQEFLAAGRDAPAHSKSGKGKKGLLPEFRPFEHFLEAGRQLRNERPFEPEPDVAPAAGHPIAIIFRRDVEPSYEGNPIAHEQFAMIANAETIEDAGVEE